MKNVAVLTEDGAFALFFHPLPGDLTAQESPSPEICHPRQKNANALGLAGEGRFGGVCVCVWGGGVGGVGCSWNLE